MNVAERGPDLSDPAIYHHWEAVTLRFSDQDSQGHINNVSYAAYIEAGRVAFSLELMRAAPDEPSDFVLAHLSIDYLAEMHYPGTIQVGTLVRRIGNKSVHLAHGIFLEGRLYATAESVLVFIDTASRRSMPVPAGMRAALERLQPAAPPPGAVRR